MTKRTEFRKRNTELFLKRNVLSGKFVVKNLLIATVAVSAVAGVVGLTSVIADSLETRPETMIVEAAPAEETKVALGNLVVTEIPQLKDDAISTLYASLEMNETVDLASRNSNLVATSADGFNNKCVVIGDALQVYENSSANSKVLGTAYKGTVATVVSNDGTWVCIESGDVKGYIDAQYILTGVAAADFASTYYKVTAVINEDSVRVRSKASTDSVYVAIAKKGQKFEVIDNATESWVKVRVDDKTVGYIRADLITVEGTYPNVITTDNSLPAATGSIKETPADKKSEGSISEQKKPVEATTEEKKPTETTEKPVETTTEKVTEATTEKPAETTTEKATEASNGQIEVGYSERTPITLSDEDLKLMAMVVTRESRGEPYEGQLAVANVILNRLESGAYGDTIYDVVYAKNQFAVVNLSNFESTVPTSSCMEACIQACNGTNNIGSYRSFRTTSGATLSKYSKYTIIGNHVFH